MKKLLLIAAFLLIPQLSQAAIGVPTNFLSLNSGLIGWWTLDGADTPWTSSTAATTLDKSGNGNTGTLTNMTQSTAFAAGKMGQALLFTGTSTQYVKSAQRVTNFHTITFSFWMKSSQPMTSTQDNWFPLKAAGYQFEFYQGAGSGIHKFAFSTNSSYFAGAVSSALTDDSLWHHIVGTYDDSASLLTVYVDGVQVGTKSAAYNSNVSSDYLTVGTAFPGSVDDVRIYSRVLSLQEINQLYQMGK